MSDLSALLGVNFSLLGTNLHAAYEKNGADGYAVLLIPSEQTADNSVNIGQVMEDIKKIVKGVNKDASTDNMQKDLENSMSALSTDSGNKFELNSIIVKLQMAYLYISKKGDTDAVVEYAFRLDIITEGLIPEAIASLVDVQNISISVWSTNRKKVLDKMALVTISDYLGEKSAEPQITGN